ncbi:MAG TPA: glycosyltransferase family 1 protein, partial [Bryobacterales bacterium]|nr:glycosyltransferase family 1 protein [Bryobacterales bacterium]
MRRVKVLHVIGQMNAGGAETWLLHVLRRLDPERFETDLLVHSSEPGLYDEEVKRLGARLIPCPPPNRPLAYARRLRRILERYGPYDVIHSHLHHLSGLVLRVGRSCSVPVRIAHSHNDTRSVDAGSSWARRFYLWLAKRWIRAYATAGWAVSPEAAAALFGPTWREDRRWRVLPCGIDLAPFLASVSRNAVRAEFD